MLCQLDDSMVAKRLRQRIQLLDRYLILEYYASLSSIRDDEHRVHTIRYNNIII